MTCDTNPQVNMNVAKDRLLVRLGEEKAVRNRDTGLGLMEISQDISTLI